MVHRAVRLVACDNAGAPGTSPRYFGQGFVSFGERAIVPQGCVGVFGKAALEQRKSVRVHIKPQQQRWWGLWWIGLDVELDGVLLDNGDHQCLQLIQHLDGLDKLQGEFRQVTQGLYFFLHFCRFRPPFFADAVQDVGQDLVLGKISVVKLPDRGVETIVAVAEEFEVPLAGGQIQIDFVGGHFAAGEGRCCEAAQAQDDHKQLRKQQHVVEGQNLEKVQNI